MFKTRTKEPLRAEELILQTAMLQSMAHDLKPRPEFKEDLRKKLAHGSYFDRCAADSGGPLSRPSATNRGCLRMMLDGIARLLGFERANGSFIRPYAFLTVYLLPLIVMLNCTPIAGPEKELSALAAEVGNYLTSANHIYYELTDGYTDRVTGLERSYRWKIWKIGTDFSYMECWSEWPEKERLNRYVTNPNGSVYLDDRNKVAQVTKYHGTADYVGREVERTYFSPINPNGGSILPTAFPRRSVRLKLMGTETWDKGIYRRYESDDGIKVWIDTSGNGCFKVEDQSGVTVDPGIGGLGSGSWIHSLEVVNVSEDSIPLSRFILNKPETYKVDVVKDMYSSLEKACNDLGFYPNLPKGLWSTYRKPGSYVVCTGGEDARLEVALVRRVDGIRADGQRDVYSAIYLSQYRPCDYDPVTGRKLPDPDQKLACSRIGAQGTGIYTWVVNGIHFQATVKSPTETTDPDIRAIYELTVKAAQYLPKV